MTMVHTASYYQPQHWQGICYRVSRRHPRGRRVQWRTLPFLYPELEHLRAYRGAEMDFDTFAQSYVDSLDRRHLTEPEITEWVDHELPGVESITLLCFEPDGKPCHRLILARWLAARTPSAQLGLLR